MLRRNRMGGLYAVGRGVVVTFFAEAPESRSA